MSGKHTPGPWGKKNGYLTGSDGSRVAVGSCGLALVAGISDDPSHDANARLIVAAPEMLAALKACALFADPSGMVNGVNIIAAIAKAEGRDNAPHDQD